MFVLYVRILFKRVIDRRKILMVIYLMVIKIIFLVLLVILIYLLIKEYFIDVFGMLLNWF